MQLIDTTGKPSTYVGGWRLVTLRSLYPIVALAILAGCLVWGVWISLVLTVVWWNIVTRTA